MSLYGDGRCQSRESLFVCQDCVAEGVLGLPHIIPCQTLYIRIVTNDGYLISLGYFVLMLILSHKVITAMAPLLLDDISRFEI